MARKRESINSSYAIYKCMSDNSHLFKGKMQNMDGISCPICRGPVLMSAYDEQHHRELPEYRDLVKQYRGNGKQYNIREGINIPDLITGLKAIQREAKEAVRLLKGLEDAKKQSCDVCGSHDVEVVTFNGNGEELTGIKCMNVECDT